jgi:hypothetical protein
MNFPYLVTMRSTTEFTDVVCAASAEHARELVQANYEAEIVKIESRPIYKHSLIEYDKDTNIESIIYSSDDLVQVEAMLDLLSRPGFARPRYSFYIN